MFCLYLQPVEPEVVVTQLELINGKVEVPESVRLVSQEMLTLSTLLIILSPLIYQSIKKRMKKEKELY